MRWLDQRRTIGRPLDGIDRAPQAAASVTIARRLRWRRM